MPRAATLCFDAELNVHGPADNPMFEGLTLNGVDLFEGVDRTNPEVRKIILNAMNADWEDVIASLRAEAA